MIGIGRNGRSAWPEYATRPSWLVSDQGARLELDAFSPTHLHALEYQGEHHFRSVRYGGIRGGDQLEETVRRDQVKVAKCAEQGIKLLVVPTLPPNWSDSTARQHVLAVLVLAAPEKRVIYEGRIASAPRYVRKEPSKLERLRTKGAERGLTLNAEVWSGYHQPHSFTCDSCGHAWSPPAASILVGGCGCPKCGRARTSAAVGAARRRHFEFRRAERFAEIKALVEAVGNTVIAESYDGCQKPFPVRCGKCDHVWDSSPAAIRKGHGCPACWRSRRNSATRAGSLRYFETLRVRRLAEAKALIEAAGNTVEAGLADELRVRCRKCSHVWSPSPANIKKGHGCPVCARADRPRDLRGQERRRQAAAMFGAGSSTSDIARALGVSRERVYQYRSELGLAQPRLVPRRKESAA